MLKAIETAYKGYRFRSRLEARWAVFLDAMGEKWEYEPEGYDLGDGVLYLPDFWMPEMECFVEVKATTPNDGEKEKARRLSEQSGHWVDIVYGQFPNVRVTAFRRGVEQEGHFRLTTCNLCGHLVISTVRIESNIPLYIPTSEPITDWFYVGHCYRCNGHAFGRWTVDLRSTKLGDAFVKANQARFEHGETGRTMKGSRL